MSIFDGNLKQRLIGAVVLIVLAVVFLPMIFNNKGEKLPETVVTVPLEPTQPEPPVTQPTPEIVTVPAQTTSQTEQIAQPNVDTTSTEGAVVTTAPATTTPVTSTEQTNNTAPTTTTATKPTVSKPNAQGITPTWTVQVAAASNLKNVEILRDKLRKAGYNAYIRSESSIHRVFVGPFNTKAAAADVRQLIEKQFKEKGFIIEFKPERQ